MGKFTGIQKEICSKNIFQLDFKTFLKGALLEVVQKGLNKV